MTQIRSPRVEDRAEWVRMRRALWPTCPDEEHDAEIGLFLQSSHDTSHADMAWARSPSGSPSVPLAGCAASWRRRSGPMPKDRRRNQSATSKAGMSIPT